MTPFLAFLQAAPAAGGGSSMLPFLFQIGAIFLIFYFLMIRPQQRQRKQHEERLRSIRKGDSVVTAGGIVGEVVHIREQQKDGQPVRALDDHITIKSGESRLVVERGRIARILGETPSADASIAAK